MLLLFIFLLIKFLEFFKFLDANYRKLASIYRKLK